jgi:hypothetical protein
MKNKQKYETKYGYTIKVGEELESLDIIQEENIPNREAIKIKIFEERWRTPKELKELLQKVIIVIERDFIN